MLQPSPPIERRTDGAVAGVLAGIAILLSLAMQPRFGMGWDEGFYYPAFVDVWEWVKLFFRAPLQALSADGIQSGWSHIDELPPVTKWLGALGVAITPSWGSPLFFSRLPFLILFGATVAVIYFAARTFASREWATLAAVAFLLHPHLFGYAQFAATEIPFAFLTAATILVLLRGWPCRWQWRAVLVALVALAFATKINGLILGFAVCCWLVLRNVVGTEPNRAWRNDLITVGLLVSVAPLAAIAIWPWMWHETFARVAGYWQFATQERLYGVWYLGEKWVRPPGNLQPVPWHYVPVMTAVCTPVIWLALALTAIVRDTGEALRVRTTATVERVLLLGLLAAGPMAAIMLPGTGKYDSLRLFLPTFVPVAIWIAAAAPLAGRLPASATRPWLAPAVAGALLALSVLPFLGEGIRYYNLPTKVVGAQADFFPFERSTWAEAATPELFREIENHFPGDQPIRVRPMALHGRVFEIHQEWGTISSRFVFDADPPYDAHLLHNRKGFWGNAAWWLRTNREPLDQWPRNAREPLFYLFDGRPPGTHD